MALYKGGLRNLDSLSVENLSSSITVNSITETADFVFVGSDATTTTWPARVGSTDLSIGSSGNDPSVKQSAFPLGGHTEAVKFNEGKVYISDTPDYDIRSNDFVVELICRPVDATGAIGGKVQSDTYEFQPATISGRQSMYFSIGDGVTTVAMQGPDHDYDAWYHYIVFGDRSGSMSMYVNGSLGAESSISAVGDVDTSGGNLIIGGRAASLKSEGYVAWFALWTRATWHSSHYNPLVAQERFNALVSR